jgi:3-oxoacyl-[acyl-carrier-protein] synthase-3
LGLAQGLIETGQARNVLLITAETYSKFIHPKDRSVRTIFGDAAAATLLRAIDRPEPLLGPYVYGTDGKGAPNLIVEAGALRRPHSSETCAETVDESGNIRTADHLYMNGPEIYSFTLKAVPKAVAAVLEKSGLTRESVDLFVFHQANRYMLEHLRKQIRIPPEKFQLAMGHCGNTVSSTIPIALKHAVTEGKLSDGSVVVAVGFGVGYSWGAVALRWHSPESIS